MNEIKQAKEARRRVSNIEFRSSSSVVDGDFAFVFRIYPGMYASDILCVCCQLHL